MTTSRVAHSLRAQRASGCFVCARDSLPMGGDACELSFSELSAVLGGQSNDDPEQKVVDQADKTYEAYKDFFAPIVRPLQETGRLAYELGS